jgi:hypothetical protein
MTLEGYEDLPGTPLPSGRITIPESESRELDRVLGSPETAPGELHPLHGFIAAQRGIGASIPDVCGLADFPVEDGPMMGTLEIELSKPMRSDVEYVIEGEVLDLVRKHGRTRGTFDLLTFRESVIDPSDSKVVASVTNSFVLPRKDPS